MKAQPRASRLASGQAAWLLLVVVLLVLATAESASANIYWANRQSPSPHYSIGRASSEPGGQVSFPHYAVIESSIAERHACGSMAADGRYLYWAEPNIYGNHTAGAINRADLSTEPPTIQRPWITSAEPSICAVTVDSNHIYWGTGMALSRAKLDGTQAEPYWGMTTATPSEPATASRVNCGLAVGSEYLYWSDSSWGVIGRSRLSDQASTSAWIHGGYEQEPCGLAVTPTHIYWTVAEQGQIRRANLDGSNAVAIVSGLAKPCGLTVHGSHLYWVNGGTSSENPTIGRSHLDGSQVEPSIVQSKASIHKSCSIAVDDRTMPTPTTPPTPSPTPAPSPAPTPSPAPSPSPSPVSSTKAAGTVYDQDGEAANKLAGNIRTCPQSWLRVRVRGRRLVARLGLRRKVRAAGRVVLTVRKRRQLRRLRVRGVAAKGTLSPGRWRIRAVFTPKRSSAYSRCRSVRRVTIKR